MPCKHHEGTRPVRNATCVTGKTLHLERAVPEFGAGY